MDKKPWQSKTVILNTLVAVVGLSSMWGLAPSVKVWLDGNTELVLTILGMVGIGLRAISKGKITLE
jgi:hypothetical protein